MRGKEKDIGKRERLLENRLYLLEQQAEYILCRVQ